MSPSLEASASSHLTAAARVSPPRVSRARAAPPVVAGGGARCTPAAAARPARGSSGWVTVGGHTAHGPMPHAGPAAAHPPSADSAPHCGMQIPSHCRFNAESLQHTQCIRRRHRHHHRPARARSGGSGPPLVVRCRSRYLAPPSQPRRRRERKGGGVSGSWGWGGWGVVVSGSRTGGERGGEKGGELGRGR